jgi:hypothetical protein
LRGEGKPFWVEILSRRDEVVARHKVHSDAGGDGILVGRGYDNDIVLDDPYVAAHHLRISRDENGSLFAEDLGSANGLFLDRDRRRVSRAALDHGGPIRIGRTFLRVREPGYAVSPERIALPPARIWPHILGLAMALLGLELLSAWLGETGQSKLGDYLGRILILFGFVILWTTAWAILSRIFSGRARFGRHLLIAVGGFLGVSLVYELTPFGAFALSLLQLSAYRYIALWIAVAVVCFLHLRAITASREGSGSGMKLKGAAVAALAIIALGMQTLSQWEDSSTADHQIFLHDLKPPALRLVPPESESAFFAGARRLKSIVDGERSGPVDQSGDYAGSVDD